MADDRLDEAGAYLLEDSLTARKAVSLTYIAVELGEESEMYGIIEQKVENYLDNTNEVLTGASTGENVSLEDLRNILSERQQRWYDAGKAAFEELTESDKEIIEDLQRGYLCTVRDDITHNGEQVELLHD